MIADSHARNWAGPEGFQLTEDLRSIYREGCDPEHYAGFDVPGTVPLFTEPGDMILFAARTYHAAFPNASDRQRLSCALVMRPRSHVVDPPWRIPASAAGFLNSLPAHLQRFGDGYTGIEPDWAG